MDNHPPYWLSSIAMSRAFDLLCGNLRKVAGKDAESENVKVSGFFPKGAAAAADALLDNSHVVMPALLVRR